MTVIGKIVLLFLAITDVVLIGKLLIGQTTVAILEPKGMIAMQQRDLIVTAILLMLVVVIPVFILTFIIAWKYRASNTKATYTPNWDHSHKVQTLWWAFPSAIIFILIILNWKTAHALDPHRPIIADTKPLTIQVVALRWKWLFIYPEQNIATVNFVAFPEKTPVNFEITADDAPMNSFWIPQLGGQMYAMTGMATRLPLIADAPGEFQGSTAELSGAGFAGMRFKAKSLSQTDFNTWVTIVKQSPTSLNRDEYTALLKPSENTPPTFYASTEPDLYTTILKKFMSPASPAGGHPTPKSNHEIHNMRDMPGT